MHIQGHMLVFTEEEKIKYREDKYKEDGSDLPTIATLLRRFESSGMGTVYGMKSANNIVDATNAHIAFMRAQESKK